MQRSLPGAFQFSRTLLRACAGTGLGRQYMFAFSKRAASTTKLDDYVKMDLLEKETAQNIKKIWIEYHRNQHCVHAILTPDQFNNIVPRTNECPIFVLPLPRKEHYETMFLQCRGNVWLITPLYDYQREGVLAKPVVNIQFFTELASSKQVVLMRGDINTDQLQTQHVQALINQLQIFYTNDELFEKFVKTFNHTPDSFDYNDLIKAVEGLGASSAPVSEQSDPEPGQKE